ncbi:hypothetical protein COU77_01805 [Candidatus Peregrinibacteria bacterium CG10_big_fil_rev_8_21_14_0_10_49_16]|nr:MAG: hypothetical protein COU77_01805 [Candidatus Peregrinibacteria bacterium CG10_big_fil_rev_8_21_14_0_10_49_16]
MSDLSKRMYLDLGWREEDIAVIVNGIDMNRFQKTENRNTPYHLPPTTYHLGCIARLSPEKGVDLLIKAVRDIPNVQLTIVGTGKDEEHIQKLARESPADITVLPSVPDVGAFYHSLDLFVLPSPEHDPCPLAPIEAIACGVPTILTDACGTAEYVSTEALVVTAGSIEALRDAIRKVISGQWTIDKERLQQVVRQKFGFERMIGEYEQLLI